MGKTVPTIGDVARRAFVSKTTVSHVVNGTRFVEEETKQRVLDAIAELGYRPSNVARSLTTKRTGSIGIIGTTSFFPSKNLGAYGDGGALITRDEILARQLRMIANHGQHIKYQHDVIGVNSRLDTIQAAILETKLTHLDAFETARRRAADFYDAHLCDLPGLMTPLRAPWSTHVFHQYTIRVRNGKRDALQQHLTAAGIPTAIYYPIPLHLQKAYRQPSIGPGSFPVAELLSAEVLSLPIHTELEEDQLSYICSSIQKFFL